MEELRVARLVGATNGDTRAEGAALSSIVSELNQGIALEHHLRFELSTWDTDEQPRFKSTSTPAGDASKLQVDSYDILICIFWTRFGSVTEDKISARYEIERAYSNWRLNGSPHVLSYFNKSESFTSPNEQIEQLKEVEAFQQSHPENLVWWHYEHIPELQQLIHNHLTYLIKDQLSTKPDRLERASSPVFNISDDEYLNFVAGRMELSNNTRARMRSCYTLSKLGGARAVTALSHALEDKATEVRIRAVESLREIHDAGATDVLIGALNSRFGDTRAYASDALEEIRGESVVKAFTDALVSPRPDVRARAAVALGHIGHYEPVPALIKTLKEDESIEVRASAVTALGNIGGEAVVSAIVDALKDSVSDIRFRAVHMLVQLRNARSIAALADAISSPHRDTRIQTAQALGQIGGERAISALTRALNDSASDVRTVAVKALGDLDDPRAAAALVEALTSRFSDVRTAATLALRESDSLLLDLIRSPDTNIRIRAAQALGQLSGDRAVDALVDALNDSVSDVRTAAAEALGKSTYGQAATALVEALSSPHSDVRAAASYALGVSNNKEALKALIDRLKDAVSYVRAQAAAALGNIGGNQATTALIETLQVEEVSEVRESIVSSLGQIGSDMAVRALVDAVKDPASNVQVKAVDILMTLNDNTVKEVLLDKIQAIGREEALEESRSFIAHEVKSAIGPLRMAAKRLYETLSESDISLEKLLPMAQRIIEHADEAYKVVEQYVNFTRLIKPALKHTNIGHLLQSCVDKVSIECESHNIKVSLESTDLPDVFIDPLLFEQAIRNLLINAIEAMERGGILRVASYEGNNSLIIEVNDTGRGIKPEHISQVFDLGFTTKIGQQGVGLGLAFVRRIIEGVHSGRVFIDNKPNLTGAIVTIDLPIAPEERVNEK